MGEILLKYYKYIGDSMGLDGKLKLAKITKIPSVNAAMEGDNPQTIELFRKSIEEITGKPAPKY